MLSFDAARLGEADIRLGVLRVAGTEYRALKIHCSGFYFDGRRLDCPEGSVRREDERGRDRPALPFSLAWRAEDNFLSFSMHDVDAVAFSPLVKRLRSWQPKGTIDFGLTVEGDRAWLGLAVRDLEFANRRARSLARRSCSPWPRAPSTAAAPGSGMPGSTGLRASFTAHRGGAKPA
ncbi:MAG: hypothetical protein M5R42_14360 [Rhodocyclaceae bacterium]|nr:hypothetical protein [Rhodocyclaceae bacterium]